ncbi:type II toxin-antitoxin system VapC family toxin [Glycocaulis abyssi]|uniref:Ribonuclease VapC n=1 Tax=Glycocaulis abyssi TaxID=1433403 RepID=A0ABV9NAE1_9PROT
MNDELIVLDASAAIAFVIPSHATTRTAALFDRLDAYTLTAPYIFAWETTNVLMRYAQRSGRSLEADLRAIDALEIFLQEAPAVEQVQASVTPAFDANLSLFDYAYLSLAVTLDAALASRDAGLLAACEALGAPFIDLR